MILTNGLYPYLSSSFAVQLLFGIPWWPFRSLCTREPTWLAFVSHVVMIGSRYGGYLVLYAPSMILIPLRLFFWYRSGNSRKASHEKRSHGRILRKAWRTGASLRNRKARTKTECGSLSACQKLFNKSRLKIWSGDLSHRFYLVTVSSLLAVTISRTFCRLSVSSYCILPFLYVWLVVVVVVVGNRPVGVRVKMYHLSKSLFGQRLCRNITSTVVLGCVLKSKYHHFHTSRTNQSRRELSTWYDSSVQAFFYPETWYCNIVPSNENLKKVHLLGPPRQPTTLSRTHIPCRKAYGIEVCHRQGGTVLKVAAFEIDPKTQTVGENWNEKAAHFLCFSRKLKHSPITQQSTSTTSSNWAIKIAWFCFRNRACYSSSSEPVLARVGTWGGTSNRSSYRSYA